MDCSIKGYSLPSNYSLLEKYHPHVLDRLQRLNPAPAGKVVLSEGGIPNLCMDKPGETVFVHPEDAPESESEVFRQKIPRDFSGVEVILGMGLGYGPKWILKHRGKIRHLVVVETDPGIFIQALKYADLSDLLKDPRVIIGIAPENAEDLLLPARKAILLEDSQISEHPVLGLLYEEEHIKIRGMIFEYINHLNIAGATRAKFGEKMVTNRLSHLKTLGHYQKFESLENVFEGIPAYIVAGGPSLDADIHHLKAVEGKSLIFSVDTAVPAFIDNGIRPDFISAIDYKDFIYEKIATRINELPEKVCLLIQSSCTPLVLQNFPGRRKFFLLSDTGIDNWLNSLMQGKRFFAGGPSVAHLNFVAAKVMGCSPIIFVGQDLGYRTGQTHSKSAVLTYRDALEKGTKEGADMLTIKSVDGSSLLTDRGMENMKIFFEGLIAKNPGEYINCTRGGAHIEGTRVMGLEAAVARYRDREFDISHILDRICETQGKIDRVGIVHGLKKDLRIVKDLVSQIKKSDVQIRSIKDRIPALKKKWAKHQVLPSNILAMMKSLDKINGRIDGYERVWQILEEMTTQGLQQAEVMAFEIAQIKNDPAKYPVWLKKSMDRLEYVNSVRKQCLGLLDERMCEIVQFIEDEKLLMAKWKDDPEAAAELAEFYIRHQEFSLAIPYVKLLSASKEDTEQVSYLKGCLAARGRDFDRMNRHFQKAGEGESRYKNEIENFRQALGDHFAIIVEHSSQKETRVAKRLLRMGLEAAPYHNGLHELLTRFVDKDLDHLAALDRANRLDEQTEAVIYWTRVLAAFPHLPSCLGNEKAGLLFYYEGKRLYHSAEKDEAFASFRKAEALLPLDDGLMIKIADLCFLARDYDRGVVYLNKAIGLNPKNAIYWERLGDHLFQNSFFDEAISAYEQAELYFPKNRTLLEKKVQCWLQKGNRFHGQGAFDAARQCYLEGIETSPDHGQNLACLYNNMGSALKNMGQLEHALASYDKSLEILPGYAEALYNKGDYFLTLGDLDAAVEFLEKAIEKQPGMPVACQKLGELFSAMGKMDKAEEMFRQARQKDSI